MTRPPVRAEPRPHFDKQPVFLGDAGRREPLWIRDEATGLLMPAFAQDPCVCCEEVEPPPPPPPDPVLFCGCPVRTVRLAIQGLTSKEIWSDGCPPVTQDFDTAVTCNDIVSATLRYANCMGANLNGNYSTSNVVGDASSFEATFDLGTFEDISDPGVLNHYGRTRRCRGSTYTYEQWSYVYRLIVTGECRSCGGGQNQLTYRLGAQTQSRWRYVRDSAVGCTGPVEGWGTVHRIGCPNGDPGTHQCIGTT